MGAGHEALVPGLDGLLLLLLPSPHLAPDLHQGVHARQVQLCGETTACLGWSETPRLFRNTLLP